MEEDKTIEELEDMVNKSKVLLEDNKKFDTPNHKIIVEALESLIEHLEWRISRIKYSNEVLYNSISNTVN